MADLSTTDELARRMVAYNAPDVRRVCHALKVLAYARMIALAEGLSERELSCVEAAAVLHDIGIHEAERKHGSAAGPWQELEGPPVARGMLEAAGADGAFADRVCFLVGNHHTYSAIDGTDFRILVEADFLVNADEDSLPPEAIAAVERSVFRTEKGKALLRELYPAGFSRLYQ